MNNIKSCDKKMQVQPCFKGQRKDAKEEIHVEFTATLFADALYFFLVLLFTRRLFVSQIRFYDPR